MKLQSHKPLRSSAAFDSIYKKENIKSRRGLSPFKSKMESMLKRTFPTAHINYAKSRVRVGNVKRVKNIDGQPAYKVIGITEPIIGNFAHVKQVLKGEGFTGLVMGSIRTSLV